jgi:hypothetical protein
MPHYFFQVRTRDEAARVPQSREYPDLKTALAEAHSAARAMIHNQVRRTRGEVRGSLDIQDERHEPVARILLADVARQIS